MGFVRNGHVDPLGVIGVILMAWSIAAFHFTFLSHYKNIIDYHIQILSLRVASIIAIYSIVMLIALLNPTAEPVMDAIAVLFEAYSIYNYFALIVVYCGGKAAVIDIIQHSDNLLCCKPCMTNSPQCCFGAVDVSLLQFICIRPIIILLYGLTYMAGNANTSKGKLLKALGSILILIAMIGLLRMYRILHDKTASMGATTKLVIIKVLVIFLTVQDFVLQLLTSSGDFKNTPDYGLGYSEESKGARVYAFISLVEFAIASLFIGSFFHPNTLPPTADRGDDLKQLKAMPSYFEMVGDMLAFWRVFVPPPRLGDSSLKDVEMPLPSSSGPVTS